MPAENAYKSRSEYVEAGGYSRVNRSPGNDAKLIPDLVSKLTAPRVRPRFEFELADDPDRVMEKLRARLPECPNCTGVSVGRHAELFVPEEEQRVWSPWLSVTAEASESSGAVVRGRFAPHPPIWTL